MNTAGEVFFSHHGFWQDKEPQERFLSASSEPETAMIEKKHGTETRKTAHLAGRCKPIVKDRLMALAKDHGWTESFIIGVACEQFVKNSIGEKLGATLAATVSESVDERLKRIETHLARLSLEDLYEVREVKLYQLELFRAKLPPHELHALQEKIRNQARR